MLKCYYITKLFFLKKWCVKNSFGFFSSSKLIIFLRSLKHLFMWCILLHAFTAVTYTCLRCEAAVHNAVWQKQSLQYSENVLSPNAAFISLLQGSSKQQLLSSDGRAHYLVNSKSHYFSANELHKQSSPERIFV